MCRRRTGDKLTFSLKVAIWHSGQTVAFKDPNLQFAAADVL
jgi:hypothetical protein